MNEPADRLLDLAGRIADGGVVDWSVVGDQGTTGAVAGLRRIEALRGLFGAVTTPEDEAASRDVPARWGHLEVRATLGEGSFGSVYRAFDPILRRDVALKLWHGADRGPASAALLEEARSLATVRHPHVLAVHGADVHDGRVGLWTELLGGRTLEDELAARGPLPLSEWLEVALALAGALEAVHGAGLAHGDVKASNVMIDGTGRVVLTDFGAAARTATGPARAGSPLSMAPEQLAGAPLDSAADLFALGVLLYRLTSGRYPFEASTLEELEALHRAGHRPPALPRALPRRARRLVTSLLDPRPERRPAAGECLADLRWVEQAPQRRRLRLAMAGTAAALVLLVVASVWYTRHLAKERNRAQVAAAQAREVGRFLVGLFEVSDPEAGRGETITAGQLLFQGTARIRSELAGQPEVQAEMMGVLGEIHMKLGLFAEAERLYRDALDLRRSRLGPAHPEVARTLRDLAGALREKGDYAAAAAHAREALDLQVRLLGERHADTASTLRELAWILRFEGDYATAEELFREALSIHRERLGPDHEEVAESLNDLAGIRGEQGAYEESERLHREALAMRRRLFGEESLAVALSLNNLAGVLKTQDRYGEAERLHREALAVRRQLLGEEHPDVATSLNDLATVLLANRDYAGAEALLRQVVALYRRLLGDEHPYVATAMKNLAVALADQDDHEAAAEVYREALGLLRETRGERHPDVASCLTNLADLSRRAGDLGEAVRLHREALAMRRELLGDAHPHVVFSLNGLGIALRDRGEHAEAEQVLREAVRASREQPGDPSQAVASSLHNLGSVLAASRRFDEAEQAYREADALWTARLGEDHPRVLFGRCSRALLLRERGDEAGARDLLTRTLARQRRILHEGHPDVRRTEAALAELGGPVPATDPRG